MELEDFKRWKVPALREFLKTRGLQNSSKRKEELVALCFAAQVQDKPIVLTSEESSQVKARDYSSLLVCNGVKIPDPFSDLNTNWLPEKIGMVHWPPTMHMDIATYLLIHVEDKDLTKRLMSDYKEGKGYSYFDSKWLKEIYYHQISPESDICILKAESTPSERLSDIPHKIWVAINKKSGCVESAYCTCFAGLGSTCNHVAAVLFKVDHAWKSGWINQSCTSRPCEWDQYGAKNKVLAPKRISDMDWRKPHFKKKRKTTINPTARKLFSPTSKSSEDGNFTLEKALGHFYSSCPDSCALQYVSVTPQQTYLPEADFNVSNTVEVSSSLHVPQTLSVIAERALSVSDFLSNLPIYSEMEVAAIENATCGQSENLQWKEQRIGRITASNCHSVMTKVRTLNSNTPVPVDTSALVGQLMGERQPDPNIPALKYGRSLEDEARNNYQKQLSRSGHRCVSVRQCGMFVHSEHVYIGASPDGVVQCGCCHQGLVEIKCPLKNAHECPTVDSLDYLVQSDGCTQLKKSHKYYSQIQLQMGITKRPWCDFFVYSRYGHILVRVSFDLERYEELISSAFMFFENFLAPELLRACKSSKNVADDSAVTSAIVCAPPVVTSTIVRARPAVTSTIVRARPAVTSTIVHARPAVTSTIVCARPALTSTIVRTRPAVTSTIVCAPPAVTSTIARAPPAVTSTIVHARPAVTSTIVCARPALTSTIVRTRPAVTSTIVCAPPAVTSTIVRAWPAVTSTIVHARPAVTSTIVCAPPAVTSTIVRALPAVTSTIVHARPAVTSTIVCARPALTSTIVRTRPAVTSTIVCAPPAVTSTIARARPAVTSTITGAQPALISTIGRAQHVMTSTIVCAPPTLPSMSCALPLIPGSKKCKKKKRPKCAFAPLYCCNICSKICKETDVIVNDIENIVQCGECGLWFHWGCVGFIACMDDSDWVCTICSA